MYKSLCNYFVHVQSTVHIVNKPINIGLLFIRTYILRVGKMVTILLASNQKLFIFMQLHLKSFSRYFAPQYRYCIGLTFSIRNTRNIIHLQWHFNILLSVIGQIKFPGLIYYKINQLKNWQTTSLTKIMNIIKTRHIFS